MKRSLKSIIFAAAVTLATATTMTVSHAILIPATAQAGILGDIKGAAKKVGGAVKSTAKGIGAAAKAGGSFVKGVPGGIAGTAKRAGLEVGRGIGGSVLGQGMRKVGQKVAGAVRR